VADLIKKAPGVPEGRFRALYRNFYLPKAHPGPGKIKLTIAAIDICELAGERLVGIPIMG
jgi:hypothetical protein